MYMYMLHVIHKLTQIHVHRHVHCMIILVTSIYMYIIYIHVHCMIILVPSIYTVHVYNIHTCTLDDNPGT